MKTRDTLLGLTIICAFVFACAAIFTPAEILADYSASFVTTTFSLFTGVVVVALLGSLLAFLAYLSRFAIETWFSAQMQRAELTKTRRKAHTRLDVVPHDSTALLTVYDTGGKPVQTHQLTNPVWQSRQPQIETVEPIALPEPRRNLIDVFNHGERILVSGSSGSGKSTLIPWSIQAKWAQGIPSILLDPHHEYGALPGIPVIGAGRKYDDINLFLEFILMIMDVRYKQASQGVHPLSGMDSVHLIIDEMTAVSHHLTDQAALALKELTNEARKTQIQFTVFGHSPLIKDNKWLSSSIRKSLRVIETTGGNGNPIGDVLELEPGNIHKEIRRYAHPGPFSGNLPEFGDIPVPHQDDIRHMKAIQVRHENPDMGVYAVAKQVFGLKGKAKPEHAEKVRDWLNEAK